MKNDKVRRHIAQKLVVSILIFFFLCNKFIFKVYVKKKFFRVAVFFGEILIYGATFRPFDIALRFECYFHTHFRFCFQLLIHHIERLNTLQYRT